MKCFYLPRVMKQLIKPCQTIFFNFQCDGCPTQAHLHITYMEMEGEIEWNILGSSPLEWSLELEDG